MAPKDHPERTVSAHSGYALLLLIVSCSVAQAQMPASEHASHHPGAAAPPANPGAAPNATPNNAMGNSPGMTSPQPATQAPPGAPGGMGDMQKMMGEMMGKAGPGMSGPPAAVGSPGGPNTGMGPPGAPTGTAGGMGPPAGTGMNAGAGEGGAAGCCGGGGRKEIFPFLMSLTTLTPEQRTEIERLGQERIDAGSALLSYAHERLTNALQSGDHGAVEVSLRQFREGIAEVDSGVAAHRVLREGIAPKLAALEWFKADMGLPPPVAPGGSQGSEGLSIFHLFTMVLLVLFAFVMLAMYFFKMRRAAALFGRLEPNPKSPPPGSAPPLAGTAPP